MRATAVPRDVAVVSSLFELCDVARGPESESLIKDMGEPLGKNWFLHLLSEDARGLCSAHLTGAPTAPFRGDRLAVPSVGKLGPNTIEPETVEGLPPPCLTL